MGILDKYKGSIGDADVYGRSKYFPNEGQHHVVIKKCKGVNGKKGTSFVIECTVESSTSSELKAGDTVAQVCKLGGEYGYGEQEIKRFVCEINGIDPSRKDAAEQVQAIDPSLDKDDPITAFAQALIDASEDGDLDLPAVVTTWAHTTQKSKVVTRIQWEAQ